MNFWQRAVCIVLAVLMLSAVIGCGKQPAVSDPASGPDSSAPPSNDVPDVTDPPGGGGATVDPTGTSDSGSPTTPGGKATGSTAKTAGTTKAPQGDTSGGINMKDPKNPYANIPAKLNGTTVKFLMYWDPNKLDKAKFRAFEKTTGIKVQAVVSPEVTQKLSTMITAEEAPDVVRFFKAVDYHIDEDGKCDAPDGAHVDIALAGEHPGEEERVCRVVDEHGDHGDKLENECAHSVSSFLMKKYSKKAA